MVVALNLLAILIVGIMPFFFEKWCVFSLFVNEMNFAQSESTKS